MNVLSLLVDRGDNVVKTTSVLAEESYQFLWNSPADEADIIKFEKKSGYQLPKEYKEFLLKSNGGTIFKSEYEEDGYRILGIIELGEVTNQMREYGYNIPQAWYCFLQYLFSEDMMFFDLSKGKTILLMEIWDIQ